MHPDDAAECVAEELEILRARLAAAPHLRAGEVELIDRFELRVPFSKQEYRAVVPVFIPSLVVPGAPPWQQPQRAVPVKAQPVARELILRCFCDGYDGQPITAELLTADGDPLPAEQWPQTLGQQVIIQGHELYDRKFFCRRGLREFHTHPHHEDRPWDAYRESLRIYDLIPELLSDLQDKWDIAVQ